MTDLRGPVTPEALAASIVEVQRSAQALQEATSGVIALAQMLMAERDLLVTEQTTQRTERQVNPPPPGRHREQKKQPYDTVGEVLADLERQMGAAKDVITRFFENGI